MCWSLRSNRTLGFIPLSSVLEMKRLRMTSFAQSCFLLLLEMFGVNFQKGRISGSTSFPNIEGLQHSTIQGFYLPLISSKELQCCLHLLRLAVLSKLGRLSLEGQHWGKGWAQWPWCSVLLNHLMCHCSDTNHTARCLPTWAKFSIFHSVSFLAMNFQSA